MRSSKSYDPRTWVDRREPEKHAASAPVQRAKSRRSLGYLLCAAILAGGGIAAYASRADRVASAATDLVGS